MPIWRFGGWKTEHRNERWIRCDVYRILGEVDWWGMVARIAINDSPKEDKGYVYQCISRRWSE